MLTSRTNPVLSEYREVITGLPKRLIAEETRWWLKCFENPETLIPDNGYNWTLENIEHARKVLTRLDTNPSTR